MSEKYTVTLQTLLRIWDCFWLEGPKVLFRVSLALMLINERGIRQKKDTISIMRHIKSCPKLCFDAQGLLKVQVVTADNKILQYRTVDG